MVFWEHFSNSTANIVSGEIDRTAGNKFRNSAINLRIKINKKRLELPFINSFKNINKICKIITFKPV